MRLVHDLIHVLAYLNVQFVQPFDITSAVVKYFLLPGFQALSGDNEVTDIVLHCLVCEDFLG